MKNKGSATGHLSRLQVDQLMALFEKAHYFDLEDHYDGLPIPSQMPSTIISFTKDGRTKVVTTGGNWELSSKAPPRLDELEREFERIIGIEQFVGTEAERVRLFRRANVDD